MDVSIIIPLYKPDKKLLKKIISSLKNQNFKGKKEIIKVNEGLGLAQTLNYGIKKAKYETIVTLHQDCLPSNNDWLKCVTKPLEEDLVVATCSGIFDVFENKKYVPLLDEKGCAYKKSALFKAGLFDNKVFLNSGEDMDMYLKLKRIGKIIYPGCFVNHFHKGYLRAEGYKKLQNANTWGALFRIYGFGLKNFYKPLLLANPLNYSYFYWFWRGFLKKKQDFKR